MDPTAPGDVEVLEGRGIRLACPVTSYPPANIYMWYRRSQGSDFEFSSDQPSYDIENASLSNAGTYLCRASNGFSTTDATLHVFVISMFVSLGTRCICMRDLLLHGAHVLYCVCMCVRTACGRVCLSAMHALGTQILSVRF